jgi:hypothetical protein
MSLYATLYCPESGDELAIARDFGRAERGWRRRASAPKSSISARMSPRSSGSLTRGFQRLAPVNVAEVVSTRHRLQLFVFHYIVDLSLSNALPLSCGRAP